MRIRIHGLGCFIILAICVPSMPCIAAQEIVAQPPSPISDFAPTPKLKDPPEKQLTNYVETGGEYLVLTNAFGMWSSGYLRTVISAGNNNLNGELDGEHEFGDSGIYFAAGDTYNFTPNTYVSITAGW